MDQVDLDEIGIKEKLKAEVKRFKQFQKMLLNKKEQVIVDDIEIRNYTKYLLREGEDFKKRELLSCIKGSISLSNKIISLNKVKL